jgi:hypothetical protein
MKQTTEDECAITLINESLNVSSILQACAIAQYQEPPVTYAETCNPLIFECLKLTFTQASIK